MNLYTDGDEQNNQDASTDEGLNTMAVLSTLGGGGGEDVMAEGEPLGLDPEAGKAKISGSSLAVGVVVVVGAVAVLGMKLTLGAIGADNDPVEDIAQIDGFLATQDAALKTGAQGPIKKPDAESQRVLDELKINPTDHQVPADEVETNPFDISQLVEGKKPTTDDGPTAATPRSAAIEKAKAAASKLKLESVSGQIVFINGEMYRVGDKIGASGFKLESVDGLSCIIRTTDEHKLPFRLRYR